MNLYRIISLESFIDLLHNKKERYVRPSTWADTYEGYLYSKIYSKADRRTMISKMYYEICPKNYKATIDNILRLEYAKWYVYGQCWSELSDSDALWRIYSYGNHSIQIISSDESISNMLKQETSISFSIRKVKYDVNQESNLIESQLEQIHESLSSFEPFVHKRKAFEHEVENRVLIDCKDSGIVLSMKSMGANWDIVKSVENLSDEEIITEIDNRLEEYLGHIKEDAIPDCIHINLNELQRYILGVKVHPLAEPWYVDLIRGLCEEYQLCFLGKSQLYNQD